MFEIIWKDVFAIFYELYPSLRNIGTPFFEIALYGPKNRCEN